MTWDVARIQNNNKQIRGIQLLAHCTHLHTWNSTTLFCYNNPICSPFWKCCNKHCNKRALKLHWLSACLCQPIRQSYSPRPCKRIMDGGNCVISIMPALNYIGMEWEELAFHDAVHSREMDCSTAKHYGSDGIRTPVMMGYQSSALTNWDISLPLKRTKLQVR